MIEPVKAIAWGGFFGSMVAWSFVAPESMAAVAETPVKMAAATIGDLFPPSVNPKLFRRYDITLDDSVSTDVQRTQVVRKFGYGRSSEVTIVTTPSGTYSSDGINSNHVRYPGIDKKLKSWPDLFWDGVSKGKGGNWMSYDQGSFTFFVFVVPGAST